ncbi:MAG: hypothetical protein Q4B88_02475 [Moraxella sp.]|nr:hypothetical protein [Moraxella sp.]
MSSHLKHDAHAEHSSSVATFFFMTSLQAVFGRFFMRFLGDAPTNHTTNTAPISNKKKSIHLDGGACF